jgi:hypothetical protein
MLLFQGASTEKKRTNYTKSLEPFAERFWFSSLPAPGWYYHGPQCDYVRDDGTFKRWGLLLGHWVIRSQVGS